MSLNTLIELYFYKQCMCIEIIVILFVFYIFNYCKGSLSVQVLRTKGLSHRRSTAFHEIFPYNGTSEIIVFHESIVVLVNERSVNPNSS